MADAPGNVELHSHAHRLMWLALCAPLFATACGPATRGAFAAASYTSDYGYEVAYQKGTTRVLPETWNIDNFYLRDPEWVRKDRDTYITTYALDNDNDGIADRNHKAFTYELRYEHSVHAGVIWLRSIPISARLRSKDLRVLMQSYIDDIAGATYETVQFRGASAPVVIERRQAAVIIEEGQETIAGQPAYVATLDVANVDQIKLSPGVRARRVQLVLMRAPRDETITKFDDSQLTFPVVVLAGYSNLPIDFQTGIPDFHDFLRRVTIAGRAGLTLNTAPVTPPTDAPATPPATSP